MKIRSGFVSNSSSSSFIVFFDFIPKNKEELSIMMWNENMKYDDTLLDDNFKYSAVNSIYNTILSQKKNDYMQALQEIVDDVNYDTYKDILYVYNDDDTHDVYTRDEVMYMVEHYTDLVNPDVQFALDLGLLSRTNGKIIDGIKQLNKYLTDNKCFYWFEYEDHSEFDCYMHSGDGFGRLNYISFSHH